MRPSRLIGMAIAFVWGWKCGDWFSSLPLGLAVAVLGSVVICLLALAVERALERS